MTPVEELEAIGMFVGGSREGEDRNNEQVLRIVDLPARCYAASALSGVQLGR